MYVCVWGAGRDIRTQDSYSDTKKIKINSSTMQLLNYQYLIKLICVQASKNLKKKIKLFTVKVTKGKL